MNSSINTSRRFRPIRTAKPEAAKGRPLPICPYAFPAKEAPMPKSASVVANPNANAMESPIIWSTDNINVIREFSESEKEKRLSHL